MCSNPQIKKLITSFGELRDKRTASQKRNSSVQQRRIIYHMQMLWWWGGGHPPLAQDLDPATEMVEKKWQYKTVQGKKNCEKMGMFHLTKISENSGSKWNGTVNFRKLISKISFNLSRLSLFPTLGPRSAQRVKKWFVTLGIFGSTAGHKSINDRQSDTFLKLKESKEPTPFLTIRRLLRFRRATGIDRESNSLNVPVNSKTAHPPPPPGKPWGSWLFWKILVKFPAILPV